MIIVLVIVFGGIFGFDALRNHMKNQFFAHYEPPPVTISTAVAKQVSWTPYISAVGSISAFNGVNITAQQAGQVNKIYFQSGEQVKEHQLLIGQNIAIDTQDLKNYEAALQLAKVTFQRQQKLFKTHFVSASAFDESKAKLQEAQTNVDKTKVVIDQKIIKAPFAGKIGIRIANLGQYLNPGDKLTSLQAMNPLRVLFSTPEQYLSQLKIGQTIHVKIDTYPKDTFVGKVIAINSEVNNETRNIQIEANLPNNKLILVPGMFANVKVLMPSKLKVTVIPQTAINYTLYGDSVYIVYPDKQPQKKATKKTTAKAKPTYIVKRVYVSLGDSRSNLVQVLQGVKPGDVVVSSGQLKLHNNGRVIVNNSANINQAPKVLRAE